MVAIHSIWAAGCVEREGAQKAEVCVAEVSETEVSIHVLWNFSITLNLPPELLKQFSFKDAILDLTKELDSSAYVWQEEWYCRYFFW